jgi:hypothetical protein
MLWTLTASATSSNSLIVIPCTANLVVTASCHSPYASTPASRVHKREQTQIQWNEQSEEKAW